MNKSTKYKLLESSAWTATLLNTVVSIYLSLKFIGFLGLFVWLIVMLILGVVYDKIERKIDG